MQSNSPGNLGIGLRPMRSGAQVIRNSVLAACLCSALAACQAHGRPASGLRCDDVVGRSILGALSAGASELYDCTPSAAQAQADRQALLASYREKAKRGDVEARYFLADHGDPSAQLAVGVESKDLETQRYWLCRSASQSHAQQGEAFYRLGVRYDDAYADKVEAYKWYILAAKHGQKDLESRMSTDRGILTPQQIQDAEQEAIAWKLGDCGQQPARAKS